MDLGGKQSHQTLSIWDQPRWRAGREEKEEGRIPAFGEQTVLWLGTSTQELAQERTYGKQSHQHRS